MMSTKRAAEEVVEVAEQEQPTQKSKKGTKAIQKLPNPHLASLQDDHLYHLGLKASMGFQDMFGDVKFVIVGGSASRIRRVAHEVQQTLDIELPLGADLVPIGKADRYELYKVGPVICVNHGMGQPSLSILLHELAKLLYYSEVENAMIIRVGTCGGLGVIPGTVILTTEAVDGQFRPVHRACELGRVNEYSSAFDPAVVDDVFDYVQNKYFEGHETVFPVVKGKTVCADDFYTGQARLDGAICDYTEEEKMDYMRRAHDAGVRNFEMESMLLASFTKQVGIPSACMCVAFLNRLEGDQVLGTPQELGKFDERPSSIAVNYVRHKLRTMQ
eukprot:TRINITY_DN487_c0_g1_i1.p2 TRINITY_DN487_c0_g1~~TRINITY_DN487_c0_g1_i1.p2  ORF type:complete len:330 (+),score=80.68 TRINITY_DN487_c0_g1_i1:47-1036(+)